MKIARQFTAGLVLDTSDGSAVPSGLVSGAGQVPALKRRAILKSPCGTSTTCFYWQLRSVIKN